MKKLFCVLLILTFMGSTMLTTTGCSSSDNRIDILGIIFIVFAATAPVGAPAFVASQRGAESSESFQPTESYIAIVTIDDESFRYDGGIEFNGHQIKFARNIEVENTEKNMQVCVEIFAKTTYTTDSTPLFKFYHIVNGIKIAETKSVNLVKDAEQTMISTTEALLYDEWRKKAVNKNASFTEFESYLPFTVFAGVFTEVTKQLKALGETGDYNDYNTNAVKAKVESEADKIPDFIGNVPTS